MAEYAPTAVILQCEQILSDLGGLDPLRFLHLLIPYCNPSEQKGSSPQVRLFALHSVTSVIHNLSSPQILDNINVLMNSVLPSLSSSIVDLRKAAIFLLVEIYIVIGDALYPFVHDIPASQKKLLTIYISKQMERN
jgi:CLIP-associating protein 1/2